MTEPDDQGPGRPTDPESPVSAEQSRDGPEQSPVSAEQSRDGAEQSRVGAEPGPADGEQPEAEAEPDSAPRVRRALLREMRSWPSLALAAVCLVVGIPVTILLTPSQELTVAGQHLSVGARTPNLSLAGPAQLVQIGNTELDITPLEVFGPLRPRLILGPVQRNAAAAEALDPATSPTVAADAVTTIGEGFVRWYLWATLILLGFTLAATVVTGYIRVWLTLRRQSRPGDHLPSIVDIMHRSSVQIRAMTIVSVTAVVLGWAGSGALAYTGAVSGLQGVRSLNELFGTYHLSPSPAGPKVTGYTGAVIGDSRASRVGGQTIPEADPDDTACSRSVDSLAVEIGAAIGERVLNLACPGASIARGLRGEQTQAGRVLPTQIGRLKQVEGLTFVVVMIGPNDLSWADLLAYCYGVPDCRDNLTQGEFAYRLAAFDRDYGDLLRDLNDLPDQPQIIIMTSYEVFAADTDLSCRDARGPSGTAGLTKNNIDLLRNRNEQLNDVLRAGAEKYGFTIAEPRLTPLCRHSPDQMGPDIQGLLDGQPFHPTALGVVRLASSVVQVIRTAEEK